MAGAAVDRVVTLPNALSLLRLLGVPVFLWLISAGHDGWALLLLMASGWSDYVDGWLARRWDQVTRLGQLLDPVADRLYILAALWGLTARGVVPLWLALAVVGRDVLVAAALPLLRRRGISALPVNYLGKAATFNLLYAFPLLLLADGDGVLAALAATFGWAFVLWGTALYWWAGALYAVQARRVLAGPVPAAP
ncbi:CDP-alcohol phosphatidyltransferase family protein [Vallicoccus soli]|uniref:CDP-alcohol phosphatidyltransferase family protein n=1 Tax=Vallicoccus soli TaxID=2339232 RepID=A0A3A3YPI6_9ACTN|nr:CDP-alcohol phosphatidyltransferase family protein [Vallicoccus soli]RJK93130.1 CDP-alcohol phosphatidyltransferase family protein [Vallicoccus soli]